MPAELGFTTYGDGPIRVLVLHDWFCDHSGWDPTLPYLTPDRFSYVFADLRGYGKSRHIEGACTLDEAANDAIAVAEKLGWTLFSLVGHSMSGLVVQRIAQLVPDRIARMVAITPVSPAGMALPPEVVSHLRDIALADDDQRYAAVSPMWGGRLSDTWTRRKLNRWRETADPAAVAKYVEMWGCSAVSPNAPGPNLPVLIIGAAQDAPPFQAASLETSMLPFYPNGRVISLNDSGHYPMQEQPPLLAAVMERFLGE